MHIISEIFWLQKRGSAESEYEDAFWPARSFDETCERFTLAIADGATESSFSSIWAKQLARSYVRDGWDRDDSFRSSLAKRQRLWTKIVSRKPLPWYAEQKLEQGAFAAVLGLTIVDQSGSSGSWAVFASGDCCLVQIRNDEIFRSCPLSSSDGFNNSPVLLATSPSRNIAAIAEIVRQEGIWQSGDVFYLMTDALAAWFFRQAEQGAKPWEILLNIGLEESTFHEFVRAEQESARMRNDDVTLYRVDIL